MVMEDDHLVAIMIIKLIGESFGIIAGTIGIYLSRTKNDQRMRCLWKAFIALVSENSILNF